MNKYHAISPKILSGIREYRNSEFPFWNKRNKTSEQFLIDRLKKYFSIFYKKQTVAINSIVSEATDFRYYYIYIFDEEAGDKFDDEVTFNYSNFKFRNRKVNYTKHETEYVNFYIDAMNRAVDKTFIERNILNQKLKKVRNA